MDENQKFSGLSLFSSLKPLSPFPFSLSPFPFPLFPFPFPLFPFPFPLSPTPHSLPMKSRWWIYQQERFPVFKHGLLIAAFSSAAVSYSFLLRDRLGSQSLLRSPGSLLIAFVILFLFFLQLRIADEFKDYKEDCRYRPYRPVPRGLIALWELGIVAIAAGVIQFGLALSMGMPMVLLLVGIWGYIGLMSAEFFVPRWLKAHPIAYLLTHALVTPLIALYGTACDWLAVGSSFPSEILYFLLVSLLGSIVFEVGRKIHQPQDEEPGVQSYSSLWGHQRAATVWLALVLGLALTVLTAVMPLQFLAPTLLALLVLMTVSILVTWQFLFRPSANKRLSFETMSGVWLLVGYSWVGIIPLLIQEITSLK